MRIIIDINNGEVSATMIHSPIHSEAISQGSSVVSIPPNQSMSSAGLTAGIKVTSAGPAPTGITSLEARVMPTLPMNESVGLEAGDISAGAAPKFSE